MSRHFVFALVLLVLFAQPAIAQPSGTPTSGASDDHPPPDIHLVDHASQHNIFTFDYAVPTSPALNLAGLTANKTPTSTSLRGFVLALPNIVGGSQQGQSLALDLAPASFLEAPSEATFSHYRAQGYLYRLAHRTRLNLAFFEGNEDSANAAKSVGSRLAIGASASLLDSSDPLMTRDRNQNEPYLLHCLSAQNTLVNANISRYSNSALTALATANATQNNLQVAQDGLNRALESNREAEIETAFAAALAALENKPEGFAARGPYDTAQRTVIAGLLAAELAQATQTKEAADKAVEDAYSRATAGIFGPRGSATLAINECVQSASTNAQNSADLDIGLGAVWRGDPGQLSGFEDAGGVLWLAGRYPVHITYHRDAPTADNPNPARTAASSYLVAASGRFGFEEFVSTGDKTTPEMRADTREAWIGLERFSDGLHLTAQYGYRETDAREAIGRPFERSGNRYLVSAQFRLGNEDSSTWLELSYGNAHGNTDVLDDEVALLTLTFSPPKRQPITN
ncbi:MAG TPA: hypothetical protein VG841_05055 [Caulobacterales bacterium]|nr:hypothetical protein [Caulobacterales bacterium]